MVMLGTDMKIAEAPREGLEEYRTGDAYEDWLKAEGVKVYEEFYFPSLAKIELGPWERKGGSGAVIHMYECTIYVVSGRGATSIWQDEKHKQTFEWQAGSLFCIPLNAWYQNFNGSGSEPARFIAVTNAPPIMRLYKDNDFIFNCDFKFRSRYAGEPDFFSGNGKLFKRRVWQSNFIANAPDMPLYEYPGRGAGGINAALEMASNNMKNHISEFPVGTYKKAHRHGPGAHLVLLSGTGGYSLLWTKEDRSDMIKCDWQHGSMVVVPNDRCFHQHFNTGTNRARYLALKRGNLGVNTPDERDNSSHTSIKQGGWQVEYEDEDREIHDIFEKELKAHGATCRMKAFIPWCTGVVGPMSERDT